MLTEIWCRFFEDGAETNTREKLELIRPLVLLSDIEDINIYNHFAHKEGIPTIEFTKINTPRD